MVKYLYMDGIDDHLRSPVLTVDKIVLDFTFELNNPPSTLAYYLWDNRGGTPSGNNMIYVNTAGTGLSKGSAITSMKLNGVDGLSHTVVPNTRYLVEATGPLVTSDANGIEFFINYAAQATSRTKGKIYDIKLYNGITLVAHYDMSTGTVQDQSGNGNHATLTGGTFVDDGAGGGTNATVNATTANATASSAAPTVTAQKQVTVTSIAANSTASTGVPIVSTVSSYSATISGVVANAVVASNIPSVTTVRNASITAIISNVLVSAHIPTIRITEPLIFRVVFPITTNVNLSAELSSEFEKDYPIITNARQELPVNFST